MKLASVLLAAATAMLGCQNESKLDGSGGVKEGALEQKPTVAPPTPKPGANASLEDRVKYLEAEHARYADMLAWLDQIYQAQKAQEAAEHATLAVDVKPDVEGGQVEGPSGACVTLVEAWDFA